MVWQRTSSQSSRESQQIDAQRLTRMADLSRLNRLTLRVVATFRFEALHCWPEAESAAPQVGFLKHLHRHEFHVTAEKAVTHSDREVEVVTLKRQLAASVSRLTEDTSQGRSLGRMSCEDVALRLLSDLNLDSCEVLEDGENGARIERIGRP